MTSTVVDVGVFLLFVTGSVLALTATSNPPPGVGVEPDILAVTATVAFDPGSVNARSETSDESRYQRRVHGSMSELLAKATVASAGCGEESIDPEGVAFKRATERQVETRLRPRTQVIAHWRPVPGSDFGGKIVVGPSPPADRTVNTAVMTVPTPYSSVDSHDSPAVRSFTTAFVNARFPVNQMRATLTGTDGAATHAAVRYRQASKTVLGDKSAVVGVSPREANSAIAAGLAKTLSDNTNGNRSENDRDSEPSSIRRESHNRNGSVVRIVLRRWYSA